MKKKTVLINKMNMVPHGINVLKAKHNQDEFFWGILFQKPILTIFSLNYKIRSKYGFRL